MTRRGLLAGVMATAVLAVSGGVAYAWHNRNSRLPESLPTPEVAVSAEAGLAEPEHWQMAGTHAAATGQGVEVIPLGMGIVNQDGSEGYKNPPVNLAGSMLRVVGDFRLTAVMEIPKGEGTLSLYGRPPLVSDEWRADKKTLHLNIRDGILHADAIDGDYSVETAVDSQEHPFPSADQVQLVVTRVDHDLVFAANGETLGTMPDHGLFNAGTIWLGMEAGTDPWTLQSLKPEGLNGGSVTVHKGLDAAKVSRANPNGLQNLVAQAKPANPDFRIGAALALGPLVSDRQYAGLALGEFSGMTLENAGKMQFLQPRPGVFTFEEMDAMVTVAGRNNQRIHGHVAVFGEANPRWVQELPKAERRQAMVSHIETVVGRYKNDITDWDLNELLADYDAEPDNMGLRNNIWYDAFDGPDYIVAAAQAVLRANPNARLWANDFGMESDDERFGDMLGLISYMKQRGIQLNVGFQAHLDEGDVLDNGRIDKAKLASRFTALAKHGALGRISELDMDGISERNFGDVMEVALKAPNCTGVTVWGVDNGHSSGASIEGGRLELGEGLLWTEGYKSTAGLSAFTQTLQQAAATRR